MNLLAPHEEWFPDPDEPEFPPLVLVAGALAAFGAALLLLSVIWRVLL